MTVLNATFTGTRTVSLAGHGVPTNAAQVLVRITYRTYGRRGSVGVPVTIQRLVTGTHLTLVTTRRTTVVVTAIGWVPAASATHATFGEGIFGAVAAALRQRRAG